MKVEPSSGVNQLISRLPEPAQERLLKHLEPVRLDHGQVLYEARSAIEHAFFPIDGVLSALVVMSDGSMIEVGTVGNEGALGLPSSSLAAKSPHRVIVQIAGHGLRINAAVLEKMSRAEGPIKEAFVAHSAAFMFQVSQSVACNGLHPLLQRCCRWLLMTHDRVNGDTIGLTHEFLAAMLGVRRASVTEVIQALEEQGLISNSRGRIIVVDRQGMEGASCECYQDVRNEYARLLG